MRSPSVSARSSHFPAEGTDGYHRQDRGRERSAAELPPGAVAAAVDRRGCRADRPLRRGHEHRIRGLDRSDEGDALHRHHVEAAGDGRSTPERPRLHDPRGWPLHVGPRRHAGEIEERSLATGRRTPTTSSTRWSRSSSASTAPGSSLSTSTRPPVGTESSILEFLTETRGFLPAVLGDDGGDAPLDRDPVAGGRRVDRRESGLGAGSSRSPPRTHTRGWRSTSRAGAGCRSSPHRGGRTPCPMRPRRRGLSGTGLRRTGVRSRRPARLIEASRGNGTSRTSRPGEARVARPARPARSTSRRTGRSSAPGWRSLLGAIVVGLVLLLVPPIRALRRRVRLRRAAAEPRRLILETYEVFTERAAGMGLGRGPGETLDEYRRKVMETGYLSNGHLDRLTRLHDDGRVLTARTGRAAGAGRDERRRHRDPRDPPRPSGRRRGSSASTEAGPSGRRLGPSPCGRRPRGALARTAPGPPRTDGPWSPRPSRCRRSRRRTPSVRRGGRRSPHRRAGRS